MRHSGLLGRVKRLERAGGARACGRCGWRPGCAVQFEVEPPRVFGEPEPEPPAELTRDGCCPECGTRLWLRIKADRELERA